ncbi:MAG TPA: two-component sensor histidine kinase, partial [Gammaproteobacteria bacterium]|nr:two-component sensor histidine kinase [Gammaproteobacteria bacterium]
QRDAAWGEVARRLAHEIKNPLTPIQLSAERIRRKYLGEVGSAGREALDRSTRTIVQQVEAMKAMVNAFSEYARPAPLRPALLDINQLISDTVELFHREGQSTRIAMDLDSELPRIRADRNALRQVLNNLIINAQEALADNPAKMRFSTRRVSGNKAVEICLQDNGPGFPEKLIDKIFEPYVTGKEKGSGLGLAISRRIIEEHGGSIRVNNLPAGGATVIITLSLRQETGPSRPPDTRES